VSVHNASFRPAGQPPSGWHSFRGTLTVQASTMFRARYGSAGSAETLPGFSATFFTQGEYLVPVMRDILQPPGTLILSPGRVWSEPGDEGLSRASFPFVLIERDTTHNGLATFLYYHTPVSPLPFHPL